MIHVASKWKGQGCLIWGRHPNLKRMGLQSKCWQHEISTECHSKASRSSSIMIFSNDFISFPSSVPLKSSFNDVHYYQFKSFKHLSKSFNSYQEKVSLYLVPWKSYLNEISHCSLQTSITKVVNVTNSSIRLAYIPMQAMNRAGPITYYRWKWLISVTFPWIETNANLVFFIDIVELLPSLPATRKKDRKLLFYFISKKKIMNVTYSWQQVLNNFGNINIEKVRYEGRNGKTIEALHVVFK